MSTSDTTPQAAASGTASLDLDALQRAYNEATPGEWTIESDGLDVTIVAPYDASKEDPGEAKFFDNGDFDRPDDIPICMDAVDHNEARNPADMEFIALVHNAFPALVGEIARLRASLHINTCGEIECAECLAAAKVILPNASPPQADGAAQPRSSVNSVSEKPA